MKIVKWKIYEKLSPQKIGIIRENNYSKPTDCIPEKCEKLRPSCKTGCCYIAMIKCGDY